MSEESLPPTWDAVVSIPMSLPRDMRDSFFTAIADAAYAWQPVDREDWDVFVSGHPSMLDRIDNALALHEQTAAGFCSTCTGTSSEDGMRPVQFPCPTRQALQGLCRSRWQA